MVHDLRSDTVTRPTSGMLDYMMKAEVGDDVFVEDPTINRLERKCAGLFGMEAALFCPSGTMANQIAIKVHTQPGDEVIADQLSHIYHYEGGGVAVNSGASMRLLAGEKGCFTAEQVEQNINNPEDIHLPLSTLVSVENTCNKGGGSIYDFSELTRIGALCNQRGLAFHMDGARLFNAIVATEQTPEDFGRLFDSISICISKGLGAPVGSVLIGSEAFIKKARRVRKVLGGGMRQAGYLAAACIYAIDNHVERLVEDHALAIELGAVLQHASFTKNILPIETNIIVVELKPGFEAKQVLHDLKENGFLAVPFGAGRIRFVTHLDIDKAKVLEDMKKFVEDDNR